MDVLAAALSAVSAAAHAQTASNINAGRLLLPFVEELRQPELVTTNLRQAVAINNGATGEARDRARIDNTFTTNDGSILANGLGVRFESVYLNAIADGSPILSASGNIIQLFRQANGTTTSDAAFDKIFLSNATVAKIGNNTLDLRPFQIVPEKIQDFAPDLTAPLVGNPGFPSGHASFSYTQGLLFALMVPERYQQSLGRAAEYGDSRIVLGAHSPLDIIGGRILATYDVVQLLNNNPEYVGKTIDVPGGGQITTASDFTTLFDNATTDLRGVLAQGCGTDLATCAAGDGADRFSNAQSRSDNAFRLTYGLPLSGRPDLPPVVPDGAEVLLKSRFPYLSAAQRRDVLATTELPSGVPLDDGSGWARLNPYAAADGYGAFNADVAITMNAGAGGFNARDTWSNDIGGTGGLTLSGSGVLTLSGADNYSGPTRVEGGTLVVNGSILSATRVGPAGTLRGSGRIGAALVNEGTLVPGDLIGVLSVTGPFVQEKTGALEIETDGTRASRLSVSGAATIAGTLRLEQTNDAVPQFGQILTVLDAGRGITGTFAKVDLPALPGGLFYQPLYAGDSIGIMTAAPLTRFAAGRNQQAIAVALDRIRSDPDAGVQQILSALYPEELHGGVAAALDRLAPQNIFGTTLLGGRFAALLANQLAMRARTLRDEAAVFAADRAAPHLGGPSGVEGGEAAAAPNRPPHAAADGDYRGAALDDRLDGFVANQVALGRRSAAFADTQSGYTADAMTIGLDWRLAPAAAIGVAGSYLRGGAASAGGSTDAEGAAISAFATAQLGPVDIDGSASAGIAGYHTRRRLQLDKLLLTSTAAPNGRFAAFAANAGYRMRGSVAGGSMMWGPVTEIRFSNATVDAYRETGFDGLSAELRGRDVSSFQTGIGGEVAFDLATAMGTLTPCLRVTWRHELGDGSEIATANFAAAPAVRFQLHSSRAGRDFAAVAAGIAGPLGQRLKLSVGYLGEIGRGRETVHQLDANVRIAF